MNRRTFLRNTGLSIAAASLPFGIACSKKEKPTKLWDLSLAEWSLNKRIRNLGDIDGPLDHLDFAYIASSMGFTGIEYVSQLFMDKGNDNAYIAQMKQRADDHGVKSLLIMIDREGQLGAPTEAGRIETVENHMKWLDAAAALGCHSVRVNASSEGSYEEQQKLAADGLHRLCEKADPLGLNVLVENHGGLSSNGQWLSKVMEMANHKRVGTLPDFGNFQVNRETGEMYDTYKGMKELMPWAKAVSAKSYNWDEHEDPLTTVGWGGNNVVDFKRVMKIVVNAGYNGFVGVEYEGDKHSEMEGIRLTKEALDKVHAQLLAEM